MSKPTRDGFWSVMCRSWRLRCPRCGQGLLFLGWFRMRRQCDWCGLNYEREPGFFLGSIYVNYGLTAVLVTIGYLSLYFSGMDSNAAFWIVTAFAALFPLWFFRYARSLWLGLDQ